MRVFPMIAGVLAVLALSAFGLRAAGDVSASSTLTRPEDPVVMTGAAVPTLNGIAPNLLVAFQHDGTSWVQIPVQVDERDLKDYRAIYNNGIVAAGTTSLQYTDANTWTGADSNATLDGNDEIVFMSKDAAGIAPGFSEPANVITGSGVQVTVTDPLHPGQTGYVYLFRQTGALDPGAGAAYVAYNFLLDSGNYKTTYNFADGPNPENSLAFTSAYAIHFGDRWLDDQMIITAGTSSGIDILDRHKALFAPGVCGRSEDTFNDAEGAFVINKSGPVRAIRSYIGANSGPLTQREHVFYAERSDIRTFLRVHAIGSIMDFMDYDTAATGMTYYNNLNTGGAAIDGNPTPETIAAGAITWEAVNGSHGAVIHAGTVATDVPGFTYTSYYLDDTSPPVTQCTGDGAAWGSSGNYVTMAIPNTDPQGGPANFLNTTRTMYFKSPYASGPATVAAAANLAQQGATALTFSVAPFTGGGDSDGDGIADASDNCPADVNPGQENADANFVSNAPVYAQIDTTWINSDNAGNACDSDDDNDGRLDGDEASGTGCAGFVTDPLLRDTDGDRVLDGPECVRGTNPTSAASKPAVTACGPTGDSDGDKIADRIENCNYGGNPANANSDGDLCTDGREVASLNSDNTVNVADMGLLATEIARAGGPPKIVNFDINKDGFYNPADQGTLASRFGACP